MTSSNEQLVPVEQVDRDAAKSILWVETLIDDVDAIEQAFARHRLTALRTPPAVEPACTCLTELEDDAYAPGGPMSGKQKPPPCAAHSPVVEPDEGLVGPSDGEDVMSSGLEALAPTLLSAFRTTNSSPDDGYRMEFKFGSLADMHKADDEWHRLRHRLAHPLTPLIRAQALEEAAKVAEWAHMVPPDGGSPSEAEYEVAKNAAASIRALQFAREKGA